MYRLTQNEQAYKKYRVREKGCYFCRPWPSTVILKTKNFYISKNNFPYDFWDGQKVVKHLLIVSKKHMVKLNSRDNKYLLEYLRLLNKYSGIGFDIYTRTSNSPSRSQIHFHTHLIKPEGKKIKSLKYKTQQYSLDVE